MKRVLLFACSICTVACSRDALPLMPAAPGVQAQGLSGCGLDQGSDTSRVVIASVFGPYGGAQALWFVRSDGSSFSAATFGDERSATHDYIYIGDIDVLVERGYVLASRGSDGAALFDPRGTLIARAATRAELDETLKTAGLDSLREQIDGYRAIAPANADGSFALVPAEGPANRFAWWDPAARALTARSPSHPFLNPDGQVQWLGDAFVYIGEDSDGPVVVAEHAEGAVAAALPGYDASLGRYFYFGVSAGEWILLHHYNADRTWRFNLRTGAIQEIVKRVPADLPQFNSDATGSRLYFGLDGDGNLLDTLRTPEAAALYRSADGQTGWERVTTPVREISSLVGSAHGMTFWARSSRVVYPSLTDPQFSWSATDQSGAFPGPLDELVRRDTGVSYRFPPNDAAILDVHPNGQCAALRTQTFDEKGNFELLDMTSGHRTRISDVSIESKPTWLF